MAFASARPGFYLVAMITPKRPVSGWTKDRAGAMAAAYGAGYAGLSICHEQMRSFEYAYTASAVFGCVTGFVAYRVMMRIMRRLP